MNHTRIAIASALALVKARRPVVLPNLAFLAILVALERRFGVGAGLPSIFLSMA